MSDISAMRTAIKDDKHHLVTTLISEEKGAGKSVGPLAGYGITVKECICVKDVESTAGSGILKGYHPPFDATAIENVRDAGGTLLAKTSQDEFGFGSFSTNVGNGYKVPLNPLDPHRTCGGSSGGSGGITAALRGKKHISIAESTGGSIAAPAACCGVVGLTPTYGLVSRWGLISYGNSLDKIGPMAANVHDAALALHVIAGFDNRDSTSANHPKEDYLAALKKPVKGMRVGVIRSLVEGSDAGVRQAVEDAISHLRKCGVHIEDVELPIATSAGLSAYYLIAMCEASTNLACFSGIRYGAVEPLSGTFNEYFSTVRSLHLGPEAKRRILLGTYARMAGFRDAYYLKALKVRAKIIAEYKAVFKRVDALLSPTLPSIAPRFDHIAKLSPAQNYLMDNCVTPINVVGMPHISVPFGTSEKMPVGILICGDHFKESTILTIAHALEQRGE